MFACVRVCVTEREKERERESKCLCVRACVRESQLIGFAETAPCWSCAEMAFVFVCKRVCVCVWEWRERRCVYVCVYEGEEERERVTSS